MEELIKYFEGLEDRIATLEAELASLEAEMDELKNRPEPEPKVVEKVVEKIVEKPVEVVKEVVKEVVVEKPVVVAAPIAEKPSEVSVQPSEVSIQPEAVVEKPSAVSVQPSEEPVKEEPKEEVASPKAALYGKSVTDIRQAISLGDRFLFQRELFDQSGEKMQKTLDAINKCQSYDEAVNMLDASFHWDKETTAYTLFTAALQRRFS